MFTRIEALWVVLDKRDCQNAENVNIKTPLNGLYIYFI